MNPKHIIAAWRDEEYRESLDAGQAAALPESPIGPVDLSDVDLEQVAGGDESSSVPCTIGISAIICISIISGGTCQMDTSGCCKEEL